MPEKLKVKEREHLLVLLQDDRSALRKACSFVRKHVYSAPEKAIRKKPVASPSSLWSR